MNQRLFPIQLMLIAFCASIGSAPASAQDAAPPPPPLGSAQVTLPGSKAMTREMGNTDSVWQANAELLNQALSPYRLNLASISEAQRNALGRAVRDLIGPIDLTVYWLNSLQAAAIVFYGLTVYGDVQAQPPCPGPGDCGEPNAKLAELVRYAQRLARGFNVLHPKDDQAVLDYFYDTAVSLTTGFARCGCDKAAAAAQRLRDGARGLYAELAVFPREIGEIAGLALRAQAEADACVQR